jgi:hypothetical protein
LVFQRKTAVAEETLSESKGVFAEKFNEGQTNSLDELSLFLVLPDPFGVGQNELEDTQGLCLEKEPLSLQQLFDLKEEKEDSVIEFLRVAEKPLILKMVKILGDDGIFC